MTVGAFACVAAINGTSDTATTDAATTDTARAVREGPSVESVRGLATEHPRIAAAFALFLIGLAGLPPALLGLFGKVVVVRTAFTGDAGWLGILVALNTVLAFVYYLRVAAALFARTGAVQESASPLATTLVAARPGRSVPAATGVRP